MYLNFELATDCTKKLRVVLMGVSGAGKSEVGLRVASLAGIRFIEGDDFHSAVSKGKLAAGIPLSDLDRIPWLEALSAHMVGLERSGDQFVIACSALKRSYRDVLRSASPNLVFIHLLGNREVIAKRLSERLGHFASANILDSQFDALENLGQDELGITLRTEKSPAILAEEIIRYALNESSERLGNEFDTLDGVGLDG